MGSAEHGKMNIFKRIPFVNSTPQIPISDPALSSHFTEQPHETPLMTPNMLNALDCFHYAIAAPYYRIVEVQYPEEGPYI